MLGAESFLIARIGCHLVKHCYLHLLIIKHVIYTKLLSDISFQVKKKHLVCECCKTIPFYTHGPSLLCAEFVMGQDYYRPSLLRAELSRNRLLR